MCRDYWSKFAYFFSYLLYIRSQTLISYYWEVFLFERFMVDLRISLWRCFWVREMEIGRIRVGEVERERWRGSEWERWRWLERWRGSERLSKIRVIESCRKEITLNCHLSGPTYCEHKMQTYVTLPGSSAVANTLWP